ncbi:MAG: hypothetical protein WBD36_13155 [Bacteroidota bacterium]
MERISEEVTTYQRGRGLPGRPSPLLISIALWVSLLLYASRAHAQSSDVLIIEKTDRLTLFDSFQRSLPAKNSPAIRPFTPLRILKSRELLSDGITLTMKVETAGEAFYLLCDAKGRLVGLNSLGMVRTFADRRMFEDTVEILQSSRVIFRDPAERMSRPLSAGQRLLRSFVENGATYVRLLTRPSVYGWASLSADQEGSGWRVVRRGAPSETLSGVLLDRMNEKVRQANRNLQQIYSQLNAETGKRLVPPQWQVQSSTPISYTAVLLPPFAAIRYAQSLSTLTSVLQTYLVGTGFDAMPLQNRIEVRRK